MWSYSSFEVSCDVHLSLHHRLLHFARFTFTMSLRNVDDFGHHHAAVMADREETSDAQTGVELGN